MKSSSGGASRCCLKPLMQVHAAMRILAVIGWAAGACLLPATAQEIAPSNDGEPVRAVALKRAPLDLPFRLPAAMRSGSTSPVEFDALSAASIDAIRQRNATDARTGKRGTQIGVARITAAETVAGREEFPLAWQAAGFGVDAGMAATITARSPGALGLRVGLRLKGLPTTAQIRVSGAEDFAQAALLVADTIAQRDASGLYWTPLTDGATQTIEIHVPHDGKLEHPSALPTALGVPTVTHFFATPKAGLGGEAVRPLGASGACNQDVVCAAQTSGFINARNATAHMVYQSGGSGFVCTGTLLNDNDASSQIPYFYTAHHCIGDQSEAATLSTYWFYDNTTCGAVTDISRNAPSVSAVHGGALFLYGTSTSDVAFLRLNNSAPAGAFMLGWNSAAVSTGSQITVVHHPAGDPKKYSLGQVVGSTSQFVRAGYTLGTTEGGSSGSALMTLNSGAYQLRGGLQGGDASCANTGVIGAPGNEDNYSRFDLAFPSIRGYLADPPPVVNISAGNGGSVSPAGNQSVSFNNSLFVTVRPNAGLTPVVTGTCGGTLLGSAFITNTITGNCTVQVSFVADTETLKVFSGTNVGDIPDSSGAVQAPGAPRTVSIAVSGITQPLAKINVGFVATHSYVGDVRAVLSAPGGFPSAVVMGYAGASSPSSNGSSSDLRGAYYFGSGQSAPFCTAAANNAVIPSGGYQSFTTFNCASTSVPNFFTPLSAAQVNGTWTLTFTDGSAGDTGNVSAVWLDLVETVPLYTVTSSAGTNGSISPLGNQQVIGGNTVSFTVTPQPNFAANVSSTCGGSLAGNTFTTGPVNANCTVSASFVRVAFNVTASSTGNGNISPSGTIAAPVNMPLVLTVTPQPNHAVTMNSTCGGTLNGTVFTTAAINANCSVIATFAPLKYTVTPGVTGNGTISPFNPLMFDHGSTGQYVVTPDAGWQVSGVGGTCGGTLSGTVFTTLPITGACSVIAQFTFIPTAPGAPVLNSVVPGNARLVIAFAAGASNGSAITQYQATCTDGANTFAASAAGSPIAVEGLTNGTTYQCSVTATNGVGASPSSSLLAGTPSSSAPFTLVAIKSVKTHGAAGALALPVDPAGVMDSTATIEPRPAKPGHTLEFHFNDIVNAHGTANVMDVTAMPVGSAFATPMGTVLRVDLAGIADGSAVRVTVDGVTGASGLLNAQADIAFLVADKGGTGRVTAADIAAVKACVGSAVLLRTASCDLDQNGVINTSDVALAKSRAGKSMR